MAQIKEVLPEHDYEGSKYVASRYFYSEYDPTTHFEYQIPFKKDGKTIDTAELERDYNPQTHTVGPRVAAYQKVMQYHSDFEQVLPEESDKFLRFYRPKIRNSDGLQLDYNYDFSDVTQREFEDNVVDTILDELETYCAHKAYIDEHCKLDADYTQMTREQLDDVYEAWQDELDSHPEFIDATNKNKHSYECALYCRIVRPIEQEFKNGQWVNKHIKDQYGNEIPDKDGNPIDQYVDPYQFRKIMRLVNSIFGFKIGVEEGWFKYDKFTRKWEYINFKLEGEEDV